jgi:ketosteroid isomerase-like protein
MTETLEEAGAVGLTRAVFAYGSERDFGAMLAAFAPDCSLDLSRIGLGTYEGRPAVRRFFEDWIGSYDVWHTELIEVSDLGGGGVVLVVAEQEGHSGRRPFRRRVFRMRFAVVYQWIDGCAARVTNYVDVGEARLEAERLVQHAVASVAAA